MDGARYPIEALNTIVARDNLPPVLANMANAATDEDFDASVALYDAVRHLRSRWIFEARNGEQAAWNQARWDEDPKWLVEIDDIARKCYMKAQEEGDIAPGYDICLCELQELVRRTAGIIRSKANRIKSRAKKKLKKN